MAQSAVKERALLGIEPFWEKPTLEPPLRWERWEIMLKQAILAKEGISIKILRENPPDKVTFPPEPIYEDNVENSTPQSERDLKNSERTTQECMAQQMSENRTRRGIVRRQALKVLR